MASQEPEMKPSSSPVAADVPWYRQLLAIKNTLIIIITPILFLPIVIAYPTPVSHLLRYHSLIASNSVSVYEILSRRYFGGHDLDRLGSRE